VALIRHLCAAAALVTLGCRSGPAAPVVEAELDPAAPDFGAVELSGLGPGWRGALGRLEPARWGEVLAVRAVAPGDSGPTPALAGHLRLTREGLRFDPAFRPAGDLELVVRVDRSLIDPAGGAPGEWRFRLPRPAAAPPSTVLKAVYPATTVVPANQLRWYLQFSAPMREGEVLQRVHLVDDHGREVRQAFLYAPNELWNPARTRLTLLFDPGRVKRGLRTNRELGPPLVEGRTYTLRVDAEWPDGRGAPLREGVEHRFRVGPPDRRAPSPQGWVVSRPAVGGRSALAIGFGEPLDHALAEHLIAVAGPDGYAVRGTVSLPDDETWTFTPDAPWAPGRYRLLVHPDLEDLAGNSVGRIFDADLSLGQHASAEVGPVSLEFEPRPPQPVPAPKH